MIFFQSGILKRIFENFDQMKKEISIKRKEKFRPEQEEISIKRKEKFRSKQKRNFDQKRNVPRRKILQRSGVISDVFLYIIHFYI